MHHQGIGPYFNPVGTSMEIDTLIQIDTVVQEYISRLAQPDSILDGWQAIALQDQLVDERAHPNPYQAWDPPEEKRDDLL